MTTYAELIALRQTARDATEERRLAEQLAAQAAAALVVAETKYRAAEQQVASAHVEIAALAALAGERDALLEAAAQDDVAAANAEEQVAWLTARIAEILRQLDVLPPDSPKATELRLELQQREQELSDHQAQGDDARHAAALKRNQAAALTAQIQARLPAAETARDAAETALATATAAFETARDVDTAARARLQAAQQAEQAAQQPLDVALDALVGDLDPGVPLLLLPVRLETRYDPESPDGSRLLKIRLYVDDFHQDAHERGLTEAETVSGQSFWTELWRAGRTPAGAQRRQAAWERLVQRHGPGRSRYLARELEPTNPQARPLDTVKTLSPSELPVFPNPPISTAAWTRAAHTTMLPDRWLALGYAAGSRVFAHWGDIIPRPLATGPSPTDDLTDPADVGPGMRWMVDFEEAVKVGMGIVVRLGPGDPRHLDRLVVVGVQGTTTPAEGATAVQELLDAHAYTWGLDLVAQGTATNNDQQQPAGYARTADPAEARAIEAALAAPGDGSDAAVLAAALGLVDPDAALWRTAHAAHTDQRDAKEIAAALWPATWGYYLRQMLAPAFDDLTLDGWRRFTLDTVRGRGPLPALRAGNQPYGILPTTSLRRWRPDTPLPDLVLFEVDAAGRARHRVLWDLDPKGGWAASTDHDDEVPGFINPNSDAIGLALFDVDGDGRPELVLLEPGDDQIPPSYGLGPAVEADGTLDGEWRQIWDTPFSPALTQGAGLAVAADGTLLIARQTQAGSELAVARGLSLGSDGVDRWLPPATTDLRTLGVRGRLAGLAAANATGTGTGADLVALFVEEAGGQAELAYLVGRFDANDALQWSDPVAGPATLPAPLSIAGVELCDLDGDGRDELVLHAASHTTPWQVWTGLQLQTNGAVNGGWLGPFDAATLPDRPKAGGAAIADVGRAQAVSPMSPTGLVNLLVNARALWLEAAASGKVPFVGRGDPDHDILDILATDALSSSVAMRALLGRVYQDNLWRFAGAPLPAGIWNEVVARCGTQLQELGLEISTRLDNAAYVDPPVEWTGPWVQRGPLLETGTLSENYLKWAATASPVELHDYAGIIDRDVLLLHLVRHSTLQAYADAAMREAPPTDGAWREPELVDIATFQNGDPMIEDDTLTSWRYISRLQQGRDLGREMRDLSDTRDPRAADLTEVRDALRWLAAQPPAALERLLAETLDLSGHRLDAWITAVATARLRAQRAVPANATGMHIGGYGLVEDLKPAAGPSSTGYVHAPSLAHATTAAVLRSGHLTHLGTPGANTFAVDLSSRRVRAALELVDGIRAGQPLGALLGYRFERALQDHPTLPLARHVAALRQLAPLAAGKLIAAPADAPIEAVGARNVVDGLALLRLWRTAGITWGTAPPGQPVALPTVDSEEQKALLKALKDLNGCLDALSDLSIAESVHQAAQGNPTRAGATLDAFNRGELPPAEHDVTRSARSGIGAVHRLLALLEPPAPDDPALALWAPPSSVTQQAVRAQAEPRVNAWAARLLGDPSDVIWQASYPPAAGGGPGTTVSFTLKDLRLSPLDVLAVPGAEPGSDLERRMLLYASRNAPTGSEGKLPQVNPAPAASTGIPLARLLEVAVAARDLIAGARAAQPADLLASGETAQPAGLEELATRLNTARGRMTAARDALRAHFAFTDPAADRAAVAGALGIPVTEIATVANVLDLPPGTAVATAAHAIGLPAAPDGVRNSLLALADCGVPGAVPQTPLGTGPQERATLTDQASAADREAKRRYDAAQATPDPITSFEELLGRDFRALPVFTLANRTALTRALSERRAAGDAGPAVTEPWLHQLAVVRDGVARLEQALLLSEALTSELREGIEIAQLPPTGAAPERWVALPPPEKKTIPAGRLSLALHAPLGLALPPSGTIAGLMIDDWVEVVPNREETTAVIFDHNGPDSCALQALLLAVPPVAGRRWDIETLEDVIAETVDLVAVRSVDPDALPALGQFLPALMLACNLGGDPEGDTISTKAPLT
jgi:hypothetical protein